jgi:hypothetical protein
MFILFTTIVFTSTALIKANAENAKNSPNQDPASDQASQIGEDRKKIEDLKLQIIHLQNNSKLGFRKVVACSSVEGFGVYQPIEPGKPVQKLVLYFEPDNVSTLVSNDRFVIDCSIDFFIHDLSGKIVSGKEGMYKLHRLSRSPLFDLFYKVEINVGKNLAGGFIIRTVLNDRIKGQSATANYRFNVQTSGKKPLDPI